MSKATHNTDGSKTTFYDLFEGCTDVDSVMMKNELTGAEFTILKSLVGIIKSRKENGVQRHSGTTALRDCRKIEHYVGLIKADLERVEGRTELPSDAKTRKS